MRRLSVFTVRSSAAILVTAALGCGAPDATEHDAARNDVAVRDAVTPVDGAHADAVATVDAPGATDAAMPIDDAATPIDDTAMPIDDVTTPADVAAPVDAAMPSRDAGGPTSPSGVPMPVGDIPGWHQIFADDFTTDVPLGHFPAAVSTRWGAYPDGWMDTSHNGTYMPSRVISIAGGLLTMHLHTEGSVHMVSAPYPILPGAGGSNGQLYGRYSARFRATSAPGYKTAWLLWPDSGTWPRDGEIDFPEGNLNSTIGAFMHRQNGTSGGDQDAYSSHATYPTWHTMVLEWTASACRFELDGVAIGTSTSRIPDTSMHWVLQTETQLSGGAPASSVTSDVQLDWVTVYAPR